MRSRRIQFVVLAGILAACASAKPHVFGEFNDISPQASRPYRESAFRSTSPCNSRGRPTSPCFYVVPGRGSTLLFPQDSTATQYVEAGSHLVETAKPRWH